MNLRAKLLLVFVALAFVPLVLVSGVNYLSGMSAVETLLREAAEERATRNAHRIEALLDAQEKRLLDEAGSPSLGAYVRDSLGRAGAAAPAGAQSAPSPSSGESSSASTPSSSRPDIPETVRAHLGAFFAKHQAYFDAIICLDSNRRPLFRVSGGPGGGVIFQTENIIESSVHYEGGVWDLRQAKVLRSPLAHRETYGPILGMTAPIPDAAASAEGARPSGALVIEVRLKEMFEEVARDNTVPAAALGSGGAEGARARAPRSLVALDNDSGQIVYHTTESFKHQSSAEVMPYFEAVAARMRAGGSGSGFYDAPDGDRWMAAFRQVRGVSLSLAVAENHTAASSGVRRVGLAGVALAAAAGLAAVALLLVILGRAAARIRSVARAAAGIAGGDLDQRIEVSGTGETARLAESFNLMSDRLRGQMRREAESKQFESFMRLSAMLTHDLKNAITGLSMLVSNMEKRFDRQEFRADAIESLKDATEKLRRIVVRLSEPVKSLSGEYRRDSRPTDLVPLIRRVLAAQAEPLVPLYELDVRLPETLVATVEPERVENVVENLVINALEAMGAAGGRLTVEAGAGDERHVFVSVADTGIGMSEEFLRTRLFRPFSTTKTRGVGLGLFTCKEIVETHGGRLEVESKLGAGTRFRIVLPSSLFKSGERRKAD